MSEEKELKQAQTVYKALCEMLNERDWHYEKDEENLAIKCGAQGDDLPMEIIVEVDIISDAVCCPREPPHGACRCR